MKSAIFYLIVSSVLLTGLSSCQKEYITPDVTYQPSVVLRNNQPDCRLEINAALDDPAQGNILNAFFCYDRTIQYWENAYKLLEVQLDAYEQ